MIWAIVLAAGESKRMGRAKLLLPFLKKTIIEILLERILASRVNQILIVLGSNKEKIERKIKNFSLKKVFNADYSKGMLSSIQCGFRELPEEVEAALIVLGDQPAVKSSIINKIIEAYQKSKKGIVIPVCKGKRGHPVLIETKYKKEVESLGEGMTLRDLIHRHPEDILEVEVSTSSILRDIDNIEDYEREVQKKTIILLN